MLKTVENSSCSCSGALSAIESSQQRGGRCARRAAAASVMLNSQRPLFVEGQIK